MPHLHAGQDIRSQNMNASKSENKNNAIREVCFPLSQWQNFEGPMDICFETQWYILESSPLWRLWSSFQRRWLLQRQNRKENRAPEQSSQEICSTNQIYIIGQVSPLELSGKTKVYLFRAFRAFPMHFSMKSNEGTFVFPGMLSHLAEGGFLKEYFIIVLDFREYYPSVLSMQKCYPSC